MNSDSTTQPRSRIRRYSVLACVAIVVLCITFGPAVYRQFTLTHGLSPNLISSITLKPNGDQPPVTLDDPDDIADFVTWLASTRDASRLRSAPPPTIFDGSIVFSDGNTEPINSSAILPLLEDYATLDGSERWDRMLLTPRSDVRVYFRGIMRSGDRQSLARLISSRPNNGG
ncbi:hypothetical protein K227x_22780 [Rubripirellula lacrimiformis]|uniref:Uncharacterized protein n=1 Tax=Rubripirellula lacrimiformis TaxID=1930273 RepID=A0A517N9S9_9BACT|nr:hypothetical protein [Rubripirellula lacrimiformis]QDT03893.1 hypothetical protein K227x_22780 [Rubripirellula lacrimiformis]